MKRISIFLLSALLLVMTACGGNSSEGGSSSGEANNENKSIDVWVGGQIIEEEESWEKLFDQFHEETGIKINSTYFGYDTYYDKLLVTLQGNQTPDAIFVDVAWNPTFASAGFLEPLDERVNQWDKKDDVNEAVWQSATFNDSIYGIPWYTDVRTLLYNKDLFKQAGLDPEKPPKTWDELVEYAEKISALGPDIDGYGVSGVKGEVVSIAILNFIWQNGGEVVDEAGTKSLLYSPETVEAVQFYVDMYKEHGISPASTLSMGEDEYRQLLAQNKLGMAYGGPWSFPLLENANPDLNYGSAPVPTPDGNLGPSVIGGWNFSIPKASSNKDDAWEFIKFITDTEAQTQWVEWNDGPMPVMKSAVEDNERFDDPKWESVSEQFTTGRIRPPIELYPKVSEVLQEMVQKVLTDYDDVDQEVKNAHDKINDVLGE